MFFVKKAHKSGLTGRITIAIAIRQHQCLTCGSTETAETIVGYRCPGCRKTLPVEMYNHNRARPNEIAVYCKICEEYRKKE